MGRGGVGSGTGGPPRNLLIPAVTQAAHAVRRLARRAPRCGPPRPRMTHCNDGNNARNSCNNGPAAATSVRSHARSFVSVPTSHGSPSMDVVHRPINLVYHREDPARSFTTASEQIIGNTLHPAPTSPPSSDFSTESRSTPHEQPIARQSKMRSPRRCTTWARRRTEYRTRADYPPAPPRLPV